VREDGTGLGDDAGQPRQQGRDAGTERRRDEHRAVRRIVDVEGDGPAACATAGARTAALLVTVLDSDRAAAIGELELGREHFADAVSRHGK
jgi:hypothetical protein